MYATVFLHSLELTNNCVKSLSATGPGDKTRIRGCYLGEERHSSIREFNITRTIPACDPSLRSLTRFRHNHQPWHRRDTSSSNNLGADHTQTIPRQLRNNNRNNNPRSKGTHSLSLDSHRPPFASSSSTSIIPHILCNRPLHQACLPAPVIIPSQLFHYNAILGLPTVGGYLPFDRRFCTKWIAETIF